MYFSKRDVLGMVLRAHIGKILVLTLSIFSLMAFADDSVDGYVNSSGSYTDSYNRTDSDSNSYNNYSSSSSGSYTNTPSNNQMMNEKSDYGSGYSTEYKSIIKY